MKSSSLDDRKKIQRYKRKVYMRKQYRPNKKFVHCGFDLPQYRTLEGYAKQAGLSPTTFLREAYLAYIQRKNLLPKGALDQLPRLLALIRNIANNLNQIARHTNKVKNATVFNLVKARRISGIYL